MSETNYNIQLDKLCEALRLGTITGSPRPIQGGLLHKMFDVQTTLGRYAVKALNPQIMLRPKVTNAYINSEKIAVIAAKHIPAAAARTFEGRALQEMDDQYYLIYDYINGKSLFGDDIKQAHCEKIGINLAKLHTIDFTKLSLVNDNTGEKPIPDWNFYLQKGMETNADWVNILNGNIDNLYEWSNRVSHASRLLAKDAVITHSDLDPKNVLWNKDNPIFIDWESAGFVNPMNDLFSTATDWSKDNEGKTDKIKFLALFIGYKMVIPTLKADWEAILDKGFSWLDWLEYSLKRSLWIECADEAENRMGTEHVTATIKILIQYAKDRSQLREWLKEV